MNEYLKSGRQALRSLYFLIIGLALTKAISILFESTPITHSFSWPDYSTTILFIVFLSFITRFSLGAYRILSADIEIEYRRPKIVCDIFCFFVQALLFYVYSLNYYDVVITHYTILAICVTDLFWLLILWFKYGIHDKVSSQWILHNFIISILLTINVLFFQYDLSLNRHLLLIISVIAAIIDFKINADFYFSTKSTPALRIFVAGPYGDKEPKKIIRANVDQAREIGKELALRGHYPFIPHTMLHGWERDKRFTIESFTAIDFKWLDFCDALYFIAPSQGANVEKERAIKKGLQIFESIDEVPDLITNKKYAGVA